MQLWRAAIALTGLLAIHAGSGAQPAANQTGARPDTDTFFAAVRENLARAQRVSHEFSYKERRTTLQTNPFGKLGTGGVELYQVYPSLNPELTYRRLLERDEVPLSQQELLEQDREYRSRAAKVRGGSNDQHDAARRRGEREEADARRRAQASVDDVVATLQFNVTGRGEFEGAPAVLVTFARHPQFRPKTREGQFAQKFTGTIWIHADRNEVMHVEAKSTESLAFGFGIVARLNEGTVATLTRRAVEPDLWMPTNVRVAGSGRAVMFIRKLVLDYAVEWSDYQRGKEPPGPEG
jgi:hypothetical protein